MVNSGEDATNRNLVTLSAPPCKRLSLSAITLQVSQLTHTTDSLHLCLLGAWVSALGYRRPLLSLLDRSFHLVDQNAFDANHPRMVKLPRAVACELCLVATLMPLAVTELSAPYHTEVFCSDASEKKKVHFVRQSFRSILSVCFGRVSVLKEHTPGCLVLRKCF